MILSLVKLPSDECHRTLLIIGQHWFRWWLGAVRHQATTWANVDTYLCCHIEPFMKLLGTITNPCRDYMLLTRKFSYGFTISKTNKTNIYCTVCSIACWGWHQRKHHIDGLVQDCNNSIANALELLQSCTKPPISLHDCFYDGGQRWTPFARDQ